eukprot:TRINITY_DN7245_c0_g2_i3.p2 TRINITY_DN7245_c0_g2~~TRINITY_DN7245_c0_g2_i3.p2  ORF type:complete len:236 (+),score=62.75 TRINITY_DN7245_c0_g2_i3:1434-2141(+)
MGGYNTSAILGGSFDRTEKEQEAVVSTQSTGKDSSKTTKDRKNSVLENDSCDIREKTNESVPVKNSKVKGTVTFTILNHEEVMELIKAGDLFLPQVTPRERQTNPRTKNYTIFIQEARSLIAADVTGKSDPYCVLYLLEAPKAKKKTAVKQQTLDPVWNERFTFSVPQSCTTLVIECWDEDVTTDDFLGKYEIPVNTMSALVGYPQEVKLQSKKPASKEKNLGTLLFIIEKEWEQ